MINMAKDKIELFEERLKKVIEGHELIKRYGLNEEILIVWMCHKLHMSEKQVRKMLACQEKFYNKMIKENIIDNLKK
jgi:hypothetical protein